MVATGHEFKFMLKLKNPEFLPHGTSQVSRALLNRRMWPVAAVLDSAVITHFHSHRKPY